MNDPFFYPGGLGTVQERANEGICERYFSFTGSFITEEIGGIPESAHRIHSNDATDGRIEIFEDADGVRYIRNTRGAYCDWREFDDACYRIIERTGEAACPPCPSKYEG